MKPSQKRAVAVSLKCDKSTYSLSDSIALESALHNDGDETIYLFHSLPWGVGGLQLHLYTENQKELQPIFRDEALLPPPPRDDRGIFVRLDPGQFFGTHREIQVSDLVNRPGKYIIQVEYQSPLSREWVDADLRRLNAVWREDSTIWSNRVAIEIGGSPTLPRD